jgi:Patatin
VANLNEFFALPVAALKWGNARLGIGSAHGERQGRNMRIVLSIDGGGIRGCVPARILAWFESKLGPVSSWADLIVGTSTGGILAAGLAHTADGKTPSYSANALLGLYRDYGATIFHRPWYQEMALLKVKYSAAGIESVLRRYYRDIRLSSALVPIVITAFDQAKWAPRLFKSSKAKTDPAEDCQLWEAARYKRSTDLLSELQRPGRWRHSWGDQSQHDRSHRGGHDVAGRAGVSAFHWDG